MLMHESVTVVGVPDVCEVMMEVELSVAAVQIAAW